MRIKRTKMRSTEKVPFLPESTRISRNAFASLSLLLLPPLSSPLLPPPTPPPVATASTLLLLFCIIYIFCRFQFISFLFSFNFCFLFFFFSLSFFFVSVSFLSFLRTPTGHCNLKYCFSKSTFSLSSPILFPFSFFFF